MRGKARSAYTRRRAEVRNRDGDARAAESSPGDRLEGLDGVLDDAGDDVDPVFAAKQRIHVNFRGIGLPIGGGVEPAEEPGANHEGEGDSVKEPAAGPETGHGRPVR